MDRGFLPFRLFFFFSCALIGLAAKSRPGRWRNSSTLLISSTRRRIEARRGWLLLLFSMLMKEVVVAQPLAGLLSNDAPNFDLDSLPSFELRKLVVVVVVTGVVARWFRPTCRTVFS